MNVVLPECGNGVYEAGIAAGSDEFTDEEKRLHVCYTYRSADKEALDAARAITQADWESDTSDGKLGVLSADVSESLLDFITTARPIPGTTSFSELTRAIEEFAVYAESRKVIAPGFTVMCAYKGFETDAVTGLYLTAVAFICKIGWVLGPQNTTYVTHLSASASEALFKKVMSEKRPAFYRTESDVSKSLKHNIQDIVTLLAAAKITYFMTNHHVGVSPEGPTGYVGKCVGALAGLSGVNRADLRNAIWALSKYISTRGMLKALGIPNLLDTVGTPDSSLSFINVTPAADLKLRVAASPAGTANVTTYLAGVRALAATAYVVAIPRIEGYDDAVRIEGEIKKNPAAYHMGAQFLVGAARIEHDPFTAQDKEHISAGIHALLGKSVLARGDAFLKLEEVRTATLFEMLTAIKAQVVTMSTDAVTKYLIANNTIGKARGGLALQTAKITKEDLLEAAEAVEAAAKEEAAAKAAGVVTSTLLPAAKTGKKA